MKVTERLTRYFALAGGFILLGLMFFTTLDVALRYFFNAPILGGQDISKMALLVIVASSFAYGAATKAHIAVDLIENVGQHFTRLTDLVVKLLSLGLLALLTRRSWVNALDAFEYGDASPLLELPFAPFYLVLMLGFALYFLVLIFEFIALIRPKSGKP